MSLDVKNMVFLAVFTLQVERDIHAPEFLKNKGSNLMQLDFIKASCGIYTMGPVHENNDTGNQLVLDRHTRAQRPKLYNVVMINDDYTPMEFVVEVLQKYFQKNGEAARQIMMEVHTKGRAIAGTYTYEVAETKAVEVMDLAKSRGHPFRVEPQSV